jgi:hypothetical protein
MGVINTLQESLSMEKMRVTESSEDCTQLTGELERVLLQRETEAAARSISRGGEDSIRLDQAHALGLVQQYLVTATDLLWQSRTITGLVVQHIDGMSVGKQVQGLEQKQGQEQGHAQGITLSQSSPASDTVGITESLSELQEFATSKLQLETSLSALVQRMSEAVDPVAVLMGSTVSSFVPSPRKGAGAALEAPKLEVPNQSDAGPGELAAELRELRRQLGLQRERAAVLIKDKVSVCCNVCVHVCERRGRMDEATNICV